MYNIGGKNKMGKENDMQYIKDFAKITISEVCRDLKIHRVNLMSGRASAENTKLVREEIQRRIDNLSKTES